MCTIGTDLNGLGGEHWSEAMQASKASTQNNDENSQTTISKWHPLILDEEAALQTTANVEKQND